MSGLHSLLKRVLPHSVWNLARQTWDGLQRASVWPAATFHPWRRASIQSLGDLKGRHTGQRGFIIGNGPSLKKTDLSRLRGEISFGMNRFYLIFPELGFNTTYFLSVNSLVIEQCAQDLRGLTIPKFLSWRSRRLIFPHEKAPPPPDTIFLHTTYTGSTFARDARHRLWEGATVTYVALQLAYHMGLDPVILIGIDHSFTTQGQPHETVVSQGNDLDHFDPGYFGRGFRWQLPDLETSEVAYRMARKAYQEAGREVLDATIDGHLTVFPKVEYDTLF